jgi:opacity protein-like surface antigen
MTGVKVKKFAHIAALAGLLGATPIQAAPDTGPRIHDTGIGQRATGVGATIGLKIKFGPDHVVRKSEQVKLGISAGPVMMMPDASAQDGVRRTQSSLFGFEVKPGFSASLNFAGRPILANYTKLGAAENDEGGDGDKQSTGDKIAWVAAVAGGVMVALIGGVLVYCDDNDNRCSD